MLSETIFYNSESSTIGRIKTEAVEPNKQLEKNTEFQGHCLLDSGNF